LLHLSLVTPEAREAHCSAEFPRLCLLLTRNGERALEIRVSFRGIRFGRLERDFTSSAINFGLEPPFFACADPRLSACVDPRQRSKCAAPDGSAKGGCISARLTPAERSA
jgi:hypothetical protein